MARQLGICIGATSVKVTLLDDDNSPQVATAAHHGNVPETATHLINEFSVDDNIKVLVTGGEGRRLLNVKNVLEAVSIEAAVKGLSGNPDAVVSLGGEDFVVYTMKDSEITNTFAGDKCASGTGEFFRQQLLRMNLNLEEANDSKLNGTVCSLATRCSVFMKSDCTHRLNKGEATKADIVVSLVHVMATKISEFLVKSRTTKGEVWLVGGVTQNRHLLGFLREMMPDINFVIPHHAVSFESFGAAILAGKTGELLPSLDTLFKPNRISFETYPDLNAAKELVTNMDGGNGTIQKGKKYILGVDGGSTTTKVALVDMDTREMCASYYGRTHGNPVNALRECITEVMKQAKEATGEENIEIALCATTGSSRELLGAYLETPGVYNEIIAHATATAYFDNEIDTIFEIGGQDAKYVYLRNGVPVDYAMNEACSAGTGSFLEESAHSDLNINSAPEIGPVALNAEYSLKFGEHCSAFINSDIRKAIQQGAPREAIVGGLVHSIVSNYLNRVVGNRRTGNKIALQGGVAKNPAVPLAFASILKRDIYVPPAPELLGSFGVALMAQDKQREGFLADYNRSLQDILDTDFSVEREFKCKACDNNCPIKVLKVGEHKSFFGGRCNKYTNMRKSIDLEKTGAIDYVQVRDEMMFKQFAPGYEKLAEGNGPVVGVPMAFTVYSMWPLFATFLNELGCRVIPSQEVSKEGMQHCESSFCYPGEIAHGALADLLDKGCDYYFMPHLMRVPSMTDQVHANFCPITQGIPYYLRVAFDLDDAKILRPVLRMEPTLEAAEEEFIKMAVTLGRNRAEGKKAFKAGLDQLRAFRDACQLKGREIVKQLEETGRNAIVLLGRPYNAFSADANMEIPRKISTRGYSVIPFDFMPMNGDDMVYNMYWHYGQQDNSAAVYAKKHPNLFVCYISNFSCGPDAFLLHILHWIMGSKPYLVLEIDSHTADAGIDTRVEAFMDIIEGYKRDTAGKHEEAYRRQWDYFTNDKGTLSLRNNETKEELDLHDPRVTVIVPSMGRYSTEAVTMVLQSAEINATWLPIPDVHTTQLARDVASGKECLPTLLVLGSILRFLQENKPKPDQVFAMIVPKTTGPCRTGQYSYFYERTFDDIGLKNFALLDLSADNSYSELGTGLTKKAYWGLIVADYFRDMEMALETLARDRKAALETFESIWREVLDMLKAGRYKDIALFKQLAEKIKKIPLAKQLSEVEKILVVGEIYVRRDNFSAQQLVDLLAERGIVGKITGVIEWVNYTDFVRKTEQDHALSKVPFLKKPFSREFRTRMKTSIELWYKARTENLLMSIFKPTGLIPDTPHDMNKIMRWAPKHTDIKFQTEATISTCVGTEAIHSGTYSGIVGFAPFACLPGRLIKSLLDPYLRKMGAPFISIENDGVAYPPAVVSRLEVFMLRVLRFGAKRRGLSTEQIDTALFGMQAKAEEDAAAESESVSDSQKTQ